MNREDVIKEFHVILETYGMEYMGYATVFEEKLSELEEKLHSVENPEEIAMEAMISAINFYDADWCGVIESDLKMEVWRPIMLQQSRKSMVFV